MERVRVDDAVCVLYSVVRDSVRLIYEWDYTSQSIANLSEHVQLSSIAM